ncbi:phage major capsid protein [uncultured Empedobacter sp.]|uniref:phage major capsid protein n=1 Tax=uncultured Empedobacter sp. TaxID=410844 RepID=UPI0025D03258|nr:phage major capsid protein [uncultured Empedobacter sp.]
MFKYKSQAEIDKMTTEEAEAYAVAKREFEQTENQKSLDDLAKKMQEEFKGDLDKANKSISDMQEIINQLKETADGKEAIQKGTFVSFVEKNVEEYNKNPENKQYGSSTVIKVAALMTTANVTPNVAGGFSPLFGNYIDTEIGHVPKPENIILPLVTVKTQPGTESIWTSDRINEDGDAAFIAEGALKPLADADWTSTKHDIKEVAVRWKFTKRLMMHAPAIVQDFQEHARELVDQKIDDQLLDGDGLTNNLSGLETEASAFIVPAGLAGYYVAPNIYDVIMAMATRVRLSNFKGQLTAVLNTVWMAKMAGIKDAEERYIIAPFVSPDGTRVGQVNVKFSNKIGDDAILLGDLKKFNVVFAENIMYDEGYENDDFSKNLVSRKLEAFLGTYIKASDAGAILFGDISDIQDDLVVVTP